MHSPWSVCDYGMSRLLRLIPSHVLFSLLHAILPRLLSVLYFIACPSFQVAPLPALVAFCLLFYGPNNEKPLLPKEWSASSILS
jgi:hypothetical protein